MKFRSSFGVLASRPSLALCDMRAHNINARRGRLARLLVRYPSFADSAIFSGGFRGGFKSFHGTPFFLATYI